MTVAPIPGTDTVSYISDPGGVVPIKDSATYVIPVNADGTPSGGGGGSQTNPSIVGGEYNSTPPTLTNSQTDALQLDSRGNSKVALFSADGTAAIAVRSSASDGSATSTSLLGAASYGFMFNGTTWDRARGDTTGQYVVQKGSATLATNQVSVATTAGGTQIVAARAGRARITITNLGTTDVFVGNTGVTTTAGQILIGTKGASITLHTSAAVFGIVGTGTQSVSFVEEY